MGTKQDNRLIKINSPLGEDMILVEAMSVSEGMSKLYSIELDLVHAEEEEGYTPVTVPPANILGKPVAISVKQSDGVERFFHGIVSYFQQGIRHSRFTFYKAVIVPQVWMLTQRRQTKIYQHKSVTEILEEILTGFTNRFELQGTYEKRNYCVQYQETDWDFASRLMEEEGIFYFFEHSNNEHKIVIADTPQSNKDCPGKSTIPYALKVGSEEELISSIFSLHMDYQLRPGKVTTIDLRTADLDQRRAVLRGLADRFIIEDDAGDVILHRLLRAEQHFAVIAAAVGGRLDLDLIETLLDRAGGFVGGENALAARDHADGDLVQGVDIHCRSPSDSTSSAPRRRADPCLPAIQERRRRPSKHK